MGKHFGWVRTPIGRDAAMAEVTAETQKILQLQREGKLSLPEATRRLDEVQRRHRTLVDRFLEAS
jgi:hypothetical protein